MDIQFYHEESTSLYISKVRKETFVTSLYDSTYQIRFIGTARLSVSPKFWKK